MAAKQQLLEQLVDIAEPAYQLSWQIPLAGYILLAVLLSGLAYAGWLLFRRWQYLAAKRQALILLGQIESHRASQINQLLKRVVRHYAPAHPVLSAGTAQWQAFLQLQLPTEPLPPLNDVLYQAATDDQHSQQFYRFASKWLKQLRPQTLVTLQNKPDTAEVVNA